MIAALLLMATPYVNLPNPDRQGIVRCKRAYDELETYVANVNKITWSNDIDRGGRMSWIQANEVRNEVRKTARPYLENIRIIAWEGRGDDCWRLSYDGQKAVYRTMRKYF